MAPQPSPRDQLLMSLREVILSAESYRGRVAARMGFSVVESQALSQLFADGTLGQGELSRRLGLSPAATTGLVDRLTNAGVARRDPHPNDRRRAMISLTDEGVAILEGAGSYFTHSLDGLGADDVARLDRGFTLISANLRRMAEQLTTDPDLLNVASPPD